MPENALRSGLTESAKLNLIGLSPEELEAFFCDLDERPYRARQLMAWLYRRGTLQFDRMTDMSLRLRRQLDFLATLELPEVAGEHESTDGTRKWLIDIGRGQAVETVFIPEPARATLCALARDLFPRNCSAKWAAIWLKEAMSLVPRPGGHVAAAGLMP